jgi:hypothetical protein
MPLDKVVVLHIRRFRQRTSIVVIAMLFTSCATNPRSLCESWVPSSWTYLPQAPQGSAGLESSLPTTAYLTNEGKLVSSVRRLWFEHGDELIACTLARHATDDCSVRVTRFSRSSAGWAKVSDDGVLCHVTL